MAAQKRPLIPVFSQILLYGLFALLTLTVLVQSNPGTRLPSRDYGFYIYIGDQITHGRLPYRDAWESKPPAIFYLNAVGLWIGRGSRWGVWIVEYVSLVTAILFSYSILKKLWGTWPALGGTFLWLAGLDITLQGGNFTEEYPLPLHFFSIMLFLNLIKTPHRRIPNILLGVVFSFSFLFRPNNALTEMAVILVLLLLRLLQRDIKSVSIQIFWLMAGALPPMLITGYYFWSQGLFQDLLEASIFYNMAYSSTSISSSSPLMTGFTIFGAISWIAVAGYILAGFRALKKDAFFPIYAFLLLGWPLAIFLSDPARRNYPHYFINWLPFMSLLGGLTIHFLTANIPVQRRENQLWGLISNGMALFLTIIFFLADGRAAEYQKALNRLARRDTLGAEVRSRISTYVENHSNPGDKVLFWGVWPGENFMSNRESPSAYLFYPLFIRSNISQQINARFLEDIKNNPPALIVDMDWHMVLPIDSEKRAAQAAVGYGWIYPPDNLDEFYEFVTENYYVDAKVGSRTVYRLRQP
ncbi:MAG: glycosyltransferase family 39 protein [Chloroflexi bacterium]|nr:glycosyltransferase family 39 protein [Chloroflexota bacterium]